MTTTPLPTEPRLHKSTGKGYARWTVTNAQGKTVRKTKYFAGKYNSREMWRDFEKWYGTQTGQQVERRPAEDARFDSYECVTIDELVDAYLDNERGRRNPDSSDRATAARDTRALQAIDTVRKLLAPYGHRAADTFKTSELEDIQHRLMNRIGNAQATIAKKVWLIRDIFRWGAQKHLCHKDVYAYLLMVKGLRKVDGVKLKKQRATPSVDDVQKIIDAAPPTVHTMLAVQLNTGMRSGNLVDLKWADIDQSRYETDGCWIYAPQHKTIEKIGRLNIVFGSTAVQALLDYEQQRPDRGHEYIFNPQANASYYRWLISLESHNRKSLEIDPKHVAAKILKRLERGEVKCNELMQIKKHYGGALHYLRNRGYVIEKTGTKKKFGTTFKLLGYEPPVTQAPTWQSVYEQLPTGVTKITNESYTVDTYRQAMKRVAKRVGVSDIFPHLLRYRRNTTLVEQGGIEAAQAVLGHVTQEMTRRYHPDMQLNQAIETQKHYG